VFGKTEPGWLNGFVNINFNGYQGITMMNFKEAFLAQLSGQAQNRPLFMPDLGLWFEWHSRRGTLPEAYRESSLAEIASALNCPAWMVRTPWQLEYDGIDATREKTETQRVIKYHTKSGVLSEVWDLGPDGDWWQKEYPVKDEDDLDAAEEIVKAMQYRLKSPKPPEADPNPGVIDVIQVPKTPYSNMLHTLLGWSDGLMLMMAEEDRLTELLGAMEEKRNELIQNLAADFSHSIFLAPDNLDGQFISPVVFKNHLESSYQKTCETLHRRNNYLVVHIGGVSRHLLPLLAGSGIDGLAGISGPPQSDATLSEARKATGADITLWGGIPQDYVMPMVDLSLLIESVEAAKAFAEIDNRTTLGIADHVPVDAEFNRLKEIAHRINGS
jgi:hypothetical protein